MQGPFLMVLGCIGTHFHDSGSLGDRLAMIFSGNPEAPPDRGAFLVEGKSIDRMFNYNSRIKRVKEVLRPNLGVWGVIWGYTAYMTHWKKNYGRSFATWWSLTRKGQRMTGSGRSVRRRWTFHSPAWRNEKREGLRTERVWDFGGSEAST